MSNKGCKMKKFFEIELLSDVVLPATSNTEGKIKNLDFIPGSVFLGIVAKNYDEFKNKFDIFHSGKVRFNDAHILINDKPSYKIPFSFYKPKLGGDVVNFHLNEYDPKIQLKQIRSGFINSNGEYVNLNYVFRQKSAFDKEKRRSKKSAMFGYSAFEAGSKWLFSVEFDIDEEIEKVVEKLVGIKFIGKSKSAEYGKIKITEVDREEEELRDYDYNGDTLLYFNSRVSLINEYGNFTYEITPQNLGIEGEIDWEKSQVRLFEYVPYNTKRKTKEYSRICIEKGSVIVVKNYKGEIRKVGAFLSEGFGAILINPKFLTLKKPKFIKFNEKKKVYAKEQNNLVKYLLNQKERDRLQYEILEDVDEFIKNYAYKFSEVTSSQWGSIRELSIKENFVEEIENYITNGVKKDVWNNGKNILLRYLKNYHKDRRMFINILAKLMQGNRK